MSARMSGSLTSSMHAHTESRMGASPPWMPGSSGMPTGVKHEEDGESETGEEEEGLQDQENLPAAQEDDEATLRRSGRQLRNKRRRK